MGINEHPPLRKTGRFSKTTFYFLRYEYNDCQVKIVNGKAVNLGDGMGMRVLCILSFRRQSGFLDMLSNERFSKMCKYQYMK